MKKLSASLAVLVVLSLSSPVVAAPRDRDRDRITKPKSPVVSIIKRLFGVASLDEQLGPPKP